MDGAMQKQIIIRNVRFWGWQVEKTVAMLVMMALIYGFVFYYSAGKADLVENMLFYLMLSGFMFMLIIQMSYASLSLPLVLSLGSGRKEAVWGMQISNLLLYVQILLCVCLGGAALAAFSENTKQFEGVTGLMIPLAAELFLFATAMGQFATVITIRFGARGSAVFTMINIIVLIGAIGVGIMFLFPVMRNENGWLLAQETGKILGLAGAGIGIVGAICYLAGAVLIKRTVLQYEVHR